MKKKERAKTKSGDVETARGDGTGKDAPLKKRRLVNGQELVFKRPGEGSDDEDSDVDELGPMPSASGTGGSAPNPAQDVASIPVVEAQRIIIHEDD